MNVVIQNGANHCLTRAVAEELVEQFPPQWRSAVSSILILASETKEPEVAFYDRTSELAISGPSDPESLNAFVATLLLNISIVSERGSVPRKISSSLKQQHNALVAEVFPSPGNMSS